MAHRVVSPLFIWFHLLASLHAPPSVKALCCTVGLYTALESESRGLQEKGRDFTFESVVYSSRVDSSLFQLRLTELEGKTGTFSFCLLNEISCVKCLVCLVLWNESSTFFAAVISHQLFCVSICEWTTPFSFSDILNVTTPRSSALQITLRTGGPFQFYTQRAIPSSEISFIASPTKPKRYVSFFKLLNVCVCVGFLKHLRRTCLLVNMEFVSTENSIHFLMNIFLKSGRQVFWGFLFFIME